MKKTVAKTIVWAGSLLLTGMLLNGCSDQSDQHALAADLAANRTTALQLAMTQANDARDAIITANNNQRAARQEAHDKQIAVQQAMALASQESQKLRQDAENKSRWAKKINDKAIASRKAFLQTAMRKADAKQQLAEAEKAMQSARLQSEADQHDVQLAANMQHAANNALNLVLEAEQIAALSMQQFTAIQSATIQSSAIQTTATQSPVKHVPIKQSATRPAANKLPLNKPSHRDLAKLSDKKKKNAVHQSVKQPRHTKLARNNTSSKAVHNTKSTHSKATKQASKTSIAHRSLKLASLSSTQAFNLQRGRDLSRKCLLCHNLKPGSKKKFGPDLFAVLDQQAGKASQYRYSHALANATFIWNEDNLAQWVCHSGKSIKKLTGRANASTKMPNQRICGQDARDLVAYLGSLQSRASIDSNQTTAMRRLQLAGAI